MRRRPPPLTPQRRWARLRARPHVWAVLAVVSLLVSMAWNPFQRYVAAAERVAVLEQTRAELRAQVDALEDRRAQLEDPEALELIAREEFGLVKPGEIPYVVIPPEGQSRREPLVVEPPTSVVPQTAWWQRVLVALRRLIG